jgi:hypothetical protein
MQSCEQNIPDQMMMSDISYASFRDQFRTVSCRTRVIVDDFHLCLVHRDDCKYAHPFGVNYMCNSLKRHEYSR